MIAITKPEAESVDESMRERFLTMLPAIQRQARVSFRTARPELREDLIQEVVARCFTDYTRLVDLGKQEVAFPSALAKFAIAQVRAGRRVGNRLNVRDVLSGYSQHHKGYCVERLDQLDDEQEEWKEALVEDRRAGPADVATSRIDFASWLRTLPRRHRRIALKLAGGESTSTTAKAFGVTAARISQLRLWLRESWMRFQGEVGADEQPQLAVA